MLPKRKFGLDFTPAQVLVLGFMGLIFIGSLLLWAPFSQEPGQSITYLDALFTATSAVCVTGLVVVDTATQFNTIGELIVLGLIQAGGLGIMTLSAMMFLLIGKRINLTDRLRMQEALGSFSIAGVVRFTRTIVLVTILIEVIGGLLLTAYWSLKYPLKQALYWGFFHAISAYNNAGFDVTSSSLRPFAKDPFVLAIISVLVILGGIGYIVMEDVWRNRRWEKFSLHTRLVLKVTFWLLLLPFLVFLVLEWNNANTWGELAWYHKISNSFFASVTTRTAGFETVQTGLLRDASLLLTIVLMFIGASPNGTGGGIKTTTFTMIALTIRATATGNEEIQVMGRRLPRDLVDKAVAIAAIAMAAIVTLTGLLLVTERAAIEDPLNPINFQKVMFEAASAFGTVGLSAGLSQALSVPGRVLVITMMFLGRLGPLTLAVALAQRKFKRSPLHYPEDRVMIG